MNWKRVIIRIILEILLILGIFWMAKQAGELWSWVSFYTGALFIIIDYVLNWFEDL